MITTVWICSECNFWLPMNPDGHFKRGFADEGMCQGQLSAHYSKDGLESYIKNRQSWIKENIKKDCDQKTEVLYELEALLRVLEEK